MNEYSKIDLGIKKKKKVHSSYQVPQPPQETKVIEPPHVQKEIVAEQVTQEPLTLSVHEFNEQQETFEIVDAIRRWWQPPMGVHPDAMCHIMVTVSGTGVCQEVVVQQSSGVPAYDIFSKKRSIKI